MTSSTPFLLLMMICCKNFLKGASGTNKSTSIFKRMSIELGPRVRSTQETSRVAFTQRVRIYRFIASLVAF